jgi:hypothetical protein
VGCELNSPVISTLLAITGHLPVPARWSVWRWPPARSGRCGAAVATRGLRRDPMILPRLLLVALLLAASLAPTGALADPSIAASAVTIQIGSLNSSGTDVALVSTADQPKMFNVANCECDTPWTTKVTISGASSYDGTTNVYYYLGPNCTDTTSRTDSCIKLSVHKLQEYFNQSVLDDVTPRYVISPTSPTCYPSSSAQSGSNTFWVFIDWNGDQAFDDTDDTIQSLELDYDVERPGVVRNVEVTSGEEALHVSWTIPSDSDIELIQVLCARGTLPVFKEGTFKASYESAAGVCGSAGDGGIADTGVQDGGQEDAGTVQEDSGTTSTTDAGTVTGITAFSGLANADPAYLCSGTLGASTSSHRIATLQNGVTYYVAVVAVDKAGNTSPVWTMVSGTPEEVMDFWEYYKEQGGAATGCSFGRGLGAGWLGVAWGVASLMLVLILAQRRRTRRGGGCARQGALLAAPLDGMKGAQIPLTLSGGGAEQRRVGPRAPK